jgi:hypothetical protein
MVVYKEVVVCRGLRVRAWQGAQNRSLVVLNAPFEEGALKVKREMKGR